MTEKMKNYMKLVLVSNIISAIFSKINKYIPEQCMDIFLTLEWLYSKC